jgi:hypothetical protein
MGIKLVSLEEMNVDVVDNGVIKAIEWYELYYKDELLRFVAKPVEWSEPAHKLLLFPDMYLSKEFMSRLPAHRDNQRAWIRVIDWNTGKLNKKSGGGDNFLDHAQERVTGTNDIWQDHIAMVEEADALEYIQPDDDREDAFKKFGHIIAYAIRVDPKERIPHELIVDFDIKDSISNAINGYVRSGSIKFYGYPTTFHIDKIAALRVVNTDKGSSVDVINK